MKYIDFYTAGIIIAGLWIGDMAYKYISEKFNI